MTGVPLIEIEGLRVTFHGDDGRITHAVDAVDLSVANGQRVVTGAVGRTRQRRKFPFCLHALHSKGFALFGGLTRGTHGASLRPSSWLNH